MLQGSFDMGTAGSTTLSTGVGLINGVLILLGSLSA